MSKRRRESESVSRQLKKHITEKDVNQCSEEKIRLVHEKTFEKLFANARSLSRKADENQNLQNSTVKAEKNCSLCHSISNSTCWKCTMYLCSGCARYCEVCSEIFCHDCSNNELWNGLACDNCKL